MDGGQRLLVTGAGGFVGAAIVHAAQVAGHDVIATGRSAAPHRLAGSGADYRIVDLADSTAVTALMAAVRPDAVIHSAWEGVAGSARNDDSQAANIASTLALVDAAAAAGARKFVGIGSQAEYGCYDRRIVESDLPKPFTLYGVAKLSALHFARVRAEQHGLGFAWLRIFSTYGPGDHAHWLIPGIIAALLRGERPQLTLGTQKWDYLHVDDIARGALAAAVTPAAEGVFNLSSGTPVAVRAIAERLRDLAAPGLELVFGEIPFGANQIMHLEGDNSALRAATGWAPQVPLDAGLAATVAAMRAAP